MNLKLKYSNLNIIIFYEYVVRVLPFVISDVKLLKSALTMKIMIYGFGL
jgi:hypothetical protein